MFILRFAKALAALSCSGGVFLYLYKTKITYLPKALLRHFSRDLESTHYPAFICIDISTHQYLFTI